MNTACRRCQQDLVAYVHHELPPVRRREVAAHLDGCERCTAACLELRSAAQLLGDPLPRYGQPTRPALDRVWASVQAEMTRTTAPALPMLRLSMAVTAILLMFMIPMAMSGRGRAFSAAATQPMPQIGRATPVITPMNATPTTVAFYVTPAPSLQATGPAPDIFNTP